ALDGHGLAKHIVGADDHGAGVPRPPTHDDAGMQVIVRAERDFTPYGDMAFEHRAGADAHSGADAAIGTDRRSGIDLGAGVDADCADAVLRHALSCAASRSAILNRSPRCTTARAAHHGESEAFHLGQFTHLSENNARTASALANPGH